MSELDSAPELAVGESLVTDETEDLVVETTRTEETLFTTTYTDVDTGDLRLALQIDIATGETKLDPRHIDASFWTLIADGRERAMGEIKEVFSEFRDPGVKVETEERAIRIYRTGESPRGQ